MRPVGETVALIERAGLEVRDVHAMREHYVLTVAGWLENFDATVPRLVELVGEEVVRVWRLYLVGGSLAFRDGRMGVDQIVMVRPGAGTPCRWCGTGEPVVGKGDGRTARRPRHSPPGGAGARRPESGPGRSARQGQPADARRGRDGLPAAARPARRWPPRRLRVRDRRARLHDLAAALRPLPELPRHHPCGGLLLLTERTVVRLRREHRPVADPGRGTRGARALPGLRRGLHRDPRHHGRRWWQGDDEGPRLAAQAGRRRAGRHARRLHPVRPDLLAAHPADQSGPDRDAARGGAAARHRQRVPGRGRSRPRVVQAG